MLCEICHGAVLSRAEEHAPVELVERDKSGGIRTYVVHCCGGCYRDKVAMGAKDAPERKGDWTDTPIVLRGLNRGGPA
jgi:hypothetical protein